MSVYIDNYFARYRRLLLSHMIADTHDELCDMARRIGVPLHHIQDEGTTREHFDVCKQMRSRAIALGALPVTTRQLAQMVRDRGQRPTTP